MKIYIAHSSKFDFIEKLYNPIKNSKICVENDVLFPHDDESKSINTKDIIKECNLVIAEVSEVSTGLGIELGWAEAFNIPILCIYEKGKIYSPSLKYITNNFVEYENNEDMICKILININSQKSYLNE